MLKYCRRDGSASYGSECGRCNRARYGMRRTANYPMRDATRPAMSAESCVRCGLAGEPTDRHRIDKEHGYVADNYVPLCPSCHGLVTAGLIAGPTQVAR